jgi:SpoVK/Ycf46/Vps4 family AAA+-type ATPase
MSFEKELLCQIQANSPVLYIVTKEEERVEYVIRKTTEVGFNSITYTWDYLNGYTNTINGKSTAKNALEALNFIENLPTTTQSVIILKDFSKFLPDILVSRKLKKLSTQLKNEAKTIIIINNEKSIPTELEEYFSLLYFLPPNINAIKAEVARILKAYGQEIELDIFNQICTAFSGFSINQIRQIISKLIIVEKKITKQTIRSILKEKKLLLSSSNILEFCECNETFNDIGGLETLKDWLNKRKKLIIEPDLASNYGLSTPKGVLLVGIQGTGKTLIAKSIAQEWFLPLLRLDTGKLFGGLVGESESRTREMIQTVESIGPCILWIDEIDKSFSNIDTKNDSGTTKRVFGSLITWLSEKTSFVFVVATANNLDTLPVELIRKGRFDEIFFIDLPSCKEREKIFEVHLKSIRPHSWKNYSIKKLAEMSENYSGSEIKQIIEESMLKSFSKNRDLLNDDLFEQLLNGNPLSQVNSKQLQMLRELELANGIRSAS